MTGESVRTLVSRLSTLRDLAIISASAVYVAGYVVWGVYAWTNGLGTQLPVHLQYFVAGIPALVTTVAIGAALLRVPLAAQKARAWLTDTGSHQRMLLAVGLVVFASIGLLCLSFYLQSTLPLLLMITAPLFFLRVIGPFPPRRRLTAYIANIPLSLLLAVIAATWIFVYATEIFPIIPQALGGGRPACVTLVNPKDAVDRLWLSLAINSRATVQTRHELRLRALQARKSPSRSDRAEIEFLNSALQLERQPGQPDYETGPLLLWYADEKFLIVTLTGQDANSEMRYVIPRGDLTIKVLPEVSAIARCPRPGDW
jgi:hypothetical protein